MDERTGPRMVVGRAVDMGNGRSVIRVPPGPAHRDVELAQQGSHRTASASGTSNDPDMIGTVEASSFGLTVGRWPMEVTFKFARSVTEGDEFVGCDYVGPNGQYVRILND